MSFRFELSENLLLATLDMPGAGDHDVTDRIVVGQDDEIGSRVDIDGVRRWQIDSEACFTLWNTLGTDCARCMAVCPYSHPDNWMHNLVRRGIGASGRFRSLAIKGDDVLYGRRPPVRPVPEWLGPA